MYFMLNEQQCFLLATAEINLNILSSKFIYGSSFKIAGLPPSPPGLSIVLYQECSHVSIHINNSLFSDNQRDVEVEAFHGANLAVTVTYPEGNSAFHTIVIDNCRVEGGRAALGGGMSLLASESINITLSTSVLHSNRHRSSKWCADN